MTFDYDAYGQMITVTSANGTYEFRYQDSGELVSATSPSGETLARNFDRLGRLNEVGWNGPDTAQQRLALIMMELKSPTPLTVGQKLVMNMIGMVSWFVPETCILRGQLRMD